LGGTIYDYGIALAISNGKAVMVGTTNSPVLSLTNTLDILLVEID
jgi:hypothetical protein